MISFKWYGKDVSELTRDELLDVIDHLNKENNELRESNFRTLDILKLKRYDIIQDTRLGGTVFGMERQ